MINLDNNPEQITQRLPPEDSTPAIDNRISEVVLSIDLIQVCSNKNELDLKVKELEETIFSQNQKVNDAKLARVMIRPNLGKKEQTQIKKTVIHLENELKKTKKQLDVLLSCPNSSPIDFEPVTVRSFLDTKHLIDKIIRYNLDIGRYAIITGSGLIAIYCVKNYLFLAVTVISGISLLIKRGLVEHLEKEINNIKAEQTIYYARLCPVEDSPLPSEPIVLLGPGSKFPISRSEIWPTSEEVDLLNANEASLQDYGSPRTRIVFAV